MAGQRETSDVIALSAVLSADMSAEPGSSRARPDPAVEWLRRRISYFMLFRLGLLAVFMLIGGYTTWLVEDHVVGPADWVGWATIGFGYVLTVVFAWRLRPSRGVPMTLAQLRGIAWTQSLFDLAFAVVAVVLSGGIDSDFAFLFLVAVLGAATMGDRRQILTLAGLSATSFLVISLGQVLGPRALMPEPNSVDALAAAKLWLNLVRTLGALALVAILSGYLNTQLLSSVSQIGGLRALNENILRSLSSGLLTVDQDAQILFANPTAANLLGYSGNIDGMDGEELLPGIKEHLGDSGGIRNRFELAITRADDNRQVSLGLSCSPLLDENGQFLGHIINFQDVTELREMERHLRRNERLAALGALAASVAHEVRNPLAAISGCAELLEPDVEEEDKRLIKVIRSEAARLADIVTDLLDYTKPRELQRVKIDLAAAFRELAESFRADPSNAEIELVVSVPDRPTPAEVDIGQISQVLWNLVRNGSEAMDGQGRLEIGLAATDNCVRIQVRDQGRGIEAEDLERIFEPFFSTKSSGTGIGLALVHRIIEEHGGTIEVQSTPGEGTRFMLELPREARDLRRSAR